MSACCPQYSGRNNEEHLGIVRSSNLCAEIVQVASHQQPAVCALASVSLPCCVDDDGGFNFNRLFGLVKSVVFNTDKCVDISQYPTTALAAAAERTGIRAPFLCHGNGF